MVINDQKTRVVELPDVSVPVREVLRRLGYPPETREIPNEVGRIFEQEIQSAPSLLEPKGVYRLLHVESREDKILTFQGTSFVIRSRQVIQMLRESDPVVLFMVTIGPNLEKEVENLFDREETARGVILDAIGSETADAVANKLHREVLKKFAENKGLTITPRFSPGYGDWPVTVQSEVLNICDGGSIGISVNESSLMIPRKSVSAVLGWKQNKPRLTDKI